MVEHREGKGWCECEGAGRQEKVSHVTTQHKNVSQPGMPKKAQKATQEERMCVGHGRVGKGREDTPQAKANCKQTNCPTHHHLHLLLHPCSSLVLPFLPSSFSSFLLPSHSKAKKKGKEIVKMSTRTTSTHLSLLVQYGNKIKCMS